MLFKLVLTFIAAAHCLPKGYKKNMETAERLHALEKELDALKHVAEPQMERRGTCQKECKAAIVVFGRFFFKQLKKKYGCYDGHYVAGSPCWDKMKKMDPSGHDMDFFLDFKTKMGFLNDDCKEFCERVRAPTTQKLAQSDGSETTRRLHFSPTVLVAGYEPNRYGISPEREEVPLDEMVKQQEARQAEPRMERGTCNEECEAAVAVPARFFYKQLTIKYGPCSESAEQLVFGERSPCWDKMGHDGGWATKEVLGYDKMGHELAVTTWRKDPSGSLDVVVTFKAYLSDLNDCEEFCERVSAPTTQMPMPYAGPKNTRRLLANSDHALGR